MPNVPTTTRARMIPSTRPKMSPKRFLWLQTYMPISRADARTMRPRFPMKRHMPSSKQNVPNVDAKS